jgi:hypothetical protein
MKKVLTLLLISFRNSAAEREGNQADLITLPEL